MTKVRLIPSQNIFYISVMDSKQKRTSNPIERLGFIQLNRQVVRASLDLMALRGWLNSGAIPTKPLVKALTTFNIGI
ncbi:MAG: 30S ribosomal protein S16 [Candidatus Hodgkinia cicadicola]